MLTVTWLLCPKCGKKTRTQVRDDTVLFHFPLFCPKCKQEFLVNVKNNELEVVVE